MTATLEQTTGGQRPAAAFFDLDGTLISGSANIPLAIAAFRAGFVTKRELANDLKNGISFLFKGATDERSAEVRDRILQAVQGRPVADVVALGDEFMDKLVRGVQPESAELLRVHADRGDVRVIISASPTEIVSRLAAELGLEIGIGTTAAHVDGVYTGELAGPFCYQDGKAEIIRNMADEHGWDLADCYAYSDSISDLPMMRVVGHPVAVNPEKELRALAQDEGWPIVETQNWRSMRKRDVPASLLASLRERLNA